MPKLLQMNKDVHYINLPRRLLAAVGWKTGDSISFRHDYLGLFFIDKETIHFSVQRKLSFIPHVSAYRLIVPLQLVDFFGWDVGTWFKVVSFRENKGFLISVTSDVFNRQEDRLNTKSLTIHLENAKRHNKWKELVKPKNNYK